MFLSFTLIFFGAASWVPQQDEPYLILFLMLRIAQTTIIANTKITIAVPIKNSVNEIPTPELVSRTG